MSKRWMAPGPAGNGTWQSLQLWPTSGGGAFIMKADPRLSPSSGKRSQSETSIVPDLGPRMASPSIEG